MIVSIYTKFHAHFQFLLGKISSGKFAILLWDTMLKYPLPTPGIGLNKKGMNYVFYYMPPTPNKIWEDKG